MTSPAVIVISVPDALEDVLRRLVDQARELVQVLESREVTDNTSLCLKILRPAPGWSQSQPDSALWQ